MNTSTTITSSNAVQVLQKAQRNQRRKAWKRAFKGMAVPHIKSTQFFFE